MDMISAAQQGNLAQVKKLVCQGAVLFDACTCDVRLLSARSTVGAPIDVVDNNGDTALHHACARSLHRSILTRNSHNSLYCVHAIPYQKSYLPSALRRLHSQDGVLGLTLRWSRTCSPLVQQPLVLTIEVKPPEISQMSPEIGRCAERR